MEKNEARQVLDEAVSTLDSVHVITSGPKGGSERAAKLKRRAEDMVAGAMLVLAVAAVLLDDDEDDTSARDVVDAVLDHVDKALGAHACVDEAKDGGDHDER